MTDKQLKNAFLGLGVRYETLLKVYAQHNEDFTKQVGKMRSASIYQKHCTTYKRPQESLLTRYRVKDIALKE